MSFREKSAWMMIGALIVAYGWYLATVIGQLDGWSVASIDYQRSAVIATIVVVVLAAVSHAVLAIGDDGGSKDRYSGAAAIKRYARSTRGVVIGSAAVVAMGLAMVEVDHFWIANALFAGLVVAELASSGSEVLIYRRGT